MDMNRAEAFSNWLKENHTGRLSAITAKDLRNWGNRREIRHMVHALRKAGRPICSGGEGYYYASAPYEIDHTLRFLQSIQDDLSLVIHGLQHAYDASEVTDDK